MKLLDSGFVSTCCWVRRLLVVPHCPTLATTLRHFFPLCALIVDSFANMSSGIVLEMENICENTEAREDFLWSLEHKPQLLGDAAETTHSASPHVAEKNPKCSVTVNTRVKFLLIPCSSDRIGVVTSRATALLALCDDLDGSRSFASRLAQRFFAFCDCAHGRRELVPQSLDVDIPVRLCFFQNSSAAADSKPI
jgi:hypothetical protein